MGLKPNAKAQVFAPTPLIPKKKHTKKIGIASLTQNLAGAGATEYTLEHHNVRNPSPIQSI